MVIKMTELELEAMKQQYDAHTLDSDLYQDSYNRVLAEALEHKLLYEGTLHDSDKDEGVH